MQNTRLAIASLALLLVPHLAYAQPDTARRDAEARFKEGLARVQSGDFESARLAFVQAYAVLKSADVLWNLALSEQKSNHPLEALGHFKEYVKDARSSEPDRVKARKYIDELHARVGRIAVDAPGGATVIVDGKILPQLAPLSEPVDVATGEHFVEARLGDRSRTLRAFAPEGSVVSLQFRAEDLSTGNAAGPAGSPPGAASEKVVGARTTDANSDPTRDNTRWIVGGIAGGVGVVLGGVAIGFAVSSSSSGSDADKILSDKPSSACAGTRARSTDCVALNDARKSQIDKQNTALALGVAGGALVLGGVAAILFWPDKASTRTGVRVVPAVGAVNGATVVSTF